MGFTPNFEIRGNHWPIGGSETHISLSEYEIRLADLRAKVDTVLWQIDCPNWYVEPHGDKGKHCTLHIYSYLLEPVVLHAKAINHCDTVHEEFLIRTSYFGVEENVDDEAFQVSPNLTDGNLTLGFGDLEGVAEICVYDTFGRRVDAFSIDMDAFREMPYSMLELKDGLYYFVLNNNRTRIARKVMLVR